MPPPAPGAVAAPPPYTTTLSSGSIKKKAPPPPPPLKPKPSYGTKYATAIFDFEAQVSPLPFVSLCKLINRPKEIYHSPLGIELNWSRGPRMPMIGGLGS